jgi:small subunit ribosomal protein S4
MARYIGSVCKLCRREGAKLFLKGERCYTDKCAYERRPYPPGQFGMGRKRLSEYGMQLREKQKAKRIFQLVEKQFRNIYYKAIQKKGVKSLNFLRDLELRLDNVCVRAGLANSIRQARQMVRHGHYLVNGKAVDIPSYVCKTGDVIQPKGESKELLVVKEALENAKRKERPAWINFEESKVNASVARVPERDDITVPVTERYIVELYSK